MLVTNSNNQELFSIRERKRKEREIQLTDEDKQEEERTQTIKKSEQKRRPNLKYKDCIHTTIEESHGNEDDEGYDEKEMIMIRVME